MRKNRKRKETAYWKTVLIGSILTVFINLVLCGVFSFVVLREYMDEKYIPYAGMIITGISLFLGTILCVENTDKNKYIAALVIGIAYISVSLFAAYTFLNADRIAILPFAAVTIGICEAAVIFSGRKSKRRGRGKVGMVKLNKNRAG